MSVCVVRSGDSVVEYGAPQRTGLVEKPRIQTKLDAGTPDFQKKANSGLGQEEVLHIIQKPRVLRRRINNVLRTSEYYLSSDIASLFPSGSEAEPSPSP